MPRVSENKFDVQGDTIYISREGWDCVAMATYHEDYYDELCSRTWRLQEGYPYNKSLGGGLHRYMMAKWYGKDELDEFTSKGYVVDHMNNNHADCRISNLEFLKKDYNTAKGQQFDKDSDRMSHRIAVTISKDFSTGCYQLVIGCNDAIAGSYPNGSKYYVDSFKFLYDCDYSIVLTEAERILLVYETTNTISVDKSYACAIRIYHNIGIKLTEEESKMPFVFREGIPLQVVGNGMTYVKQIHPDENWLPPKSGEPIISHMIPQLVRKNETCIAEPGV